MESGRILVRHTTLYRLTGWAEKVAHLLSGLGKGGSSLGMSAVDLEASQANAFNWSTCLFLRLLLLWRVSVLSLCWSQGGPRWATTLPKASAAVTEDLTCEPLLLPRRDSLLGLCCCNRGLTYVHLLSPWRSSIVGPCCSQEEPCFWASAVPMEASHIELYCSKGRSQLWASAVPKEGLNLRASAIPIKIYI